VLARLRRLHALDVDRVAEGVAEDRLLAGRAGELRVELELEPGEAVVVDARVPEHLRGDGCLRIRAALLAVEVEARQISLREQARLVGRRLPFDVREVRPLRRQRFADRLALDAEDACRR